MPTFSYTIFPSSYYVSTLWSRNCTAPFCQVLCWAQKKPGCRRHSPCPEIAHGLVTKKIISAARGLWSPDHALGLLIAWTNEAASLQGNCSADFCEPQYAQGLWSEECSFMCSENTCCAYYVPDFFLSMGFKKMGKVSAFLGPIFSVGQTIGKQIHI